MSDPQYADGLYFRGPRDDAPDFVIGSMSIQKARFISWLNDQVSDDEGYVKLSVTKQKKDPSKWSFKLNTWKSDSEPSQAPVSKEEPTTNVGDDDDLPF